MTEEELEESVQEVSLSEQEKEIHVEKFLIEDTITKLSKFLIVKLYINRSSLQQGSVLEYDVETMATWQENIV